jgi:hypothetical protein
MFLSYSNIEQKFRQAVYAAKGVKYDVPQNNMVAEYS